MSVIELPVLSRYTAFDCDGGTPFSFSVIFGPKHHLGLAYGYLYGVGWFKGEKGHQILVDHRLCRLCIHGKMLKPLLTEFERLTVSTVYLFDPDRHAPVRSGETIVTHIERI